MLTLKLYCISYKKGKKSVYGNIGVDTKNDIYILELLWIPSSYKTFHVEIN